MFKKFSTALLITTLVCGLAACKPGAPEENSASKSGQALQYGFTLSQADFNGLSKEDQFMVANKALSTMFRGLPADEFFDLTQGLESPKVQYSDFISQTQIQLQNKLSVADLKAGEAQIFGQDDVATTDADESIPPRFTDLDERYQHLHAMARMQTYPLSHNQFVQWMSYFLANTIMFSPAVEMESTSYRDTGIVLKYLQTSLAENTAIRDVVRGWLHNPSRWRVSRSPENHALEMFELYLGIFNDTPEEQQNTINGGKACSAWNLSDADEDYQLISDPSVLEGTELYTVFNQNISTCAQLYDLVAGHPRLVARVIEVIVNYFLDGSSVAIKQGLIQSVVNSGAQSFQDVFLGVIFSRAFLLESQRPKTFEENAFGFLNSMHYTPRAGSYPLNTSVLYYMLNSNTTRPISLDNMGWAAMDYKIGRTPFLPMDPLSFATYHKGIRESVLMNQRAYDGADHPTAESFTEAGTPRDPPFAIHNGGFYVAGTENLKPELENLTAIEFIDFVFLTALGRRASDIETTALLIEGGPHIRDVDDEDGDGDVNEILDSNRNYIHQDDDGVWQLDRTNGEDLLWENEADNFAEIMLDYISRLPEFYYYRAAGQ